MGALWSSMQDAQASHQMTSPALTEAPQSVQSFTEMKEDEEAAGVQG